MRVFSSMKILEDLDGGHFFPKSNSSLILGSNSAKNFFDIFLIEDIYEGRVLGLVLNWVKEFSYESNFVEGN